MKKYIFLYLIMFFSFSCSDDFLELKPISDSASDNFFTTAEDIEVALNGAYAEFQSQAYYGNDWTKLLEYRSDNIDEVNLGRNAGQDANLNRFTESSSNDIIREAWQSMYRVINRCNVVLAKVDEVEISDGQKSRIQAEARFIRGFNYFNLVRLWGDVPLILSDLGPEEIRSTASRDSEDLVYQEIMNDLQFAVSNLPSGAPSGKATAEAASILLANVMMTRGQFSEAVSLLRAIDMTSLIPLSEVWDPGNELNDEMIFVIKFRPDVTGESHPGWYVTTESPLVHPALTQAYVDAGDLVRGPLIEPNADLGGPPIPLKFQEAPFAGSYGRDYPAIRKADAVLLLAEALNEVGYVADGEAFDLLNLVRVRAGLSALTSIDLGDQEAFRDAVLGERRLELALEGHRWFDLKRTGKAIDAIGVVGKTIESFQLLYPIPITEIEAFQDETRFPQNPGY